MNTSPVLAWNQRSKRFIFKPILTQKDLDIEVQAYKAEMLRDGCSQVWTQKYNGLRDYLTQNRIKQVVLGVSGGVDSALVLALLMDVAAVQPLTIHACCFTFEQYEGIFDYSYINVLKRMTETSNVNVVWYEKDLSSVDRALYRALDIIHTEDQQANVNYALRYQALFAVAQSVGGVTIGTTNFDEFAYAGWFGKNSDMVVDLQCITDLHKFEVNTLARALGVPSSIIHRSPVGDLITNKTDEQCFGVTYDELSWFTGYMVSQHTTMDDRFTRVDTQMEMLNPFIKDKFSNVIALHKKNRHKYAGQTFNPIFIL